MDLVIKPTRACNFKCSFCSSNLIPNKKLNLDVVKDFLLKNDVSTIIVNGGDPLMMPVSYYEELVDFINEHNMNISVSFTTKCCPNDLERAFITFPFAKNLPNISEDPAVI